MLRMWRAQPAMGECHLRRVHLSGVLGQTPQFGRALELRAIDHARQVEGHRAGENESGRQSQGQRVLRIAAELQVEHVAAAEVQFARGRSLPRQDLDRSERQTVVGGHGQHSPQSVVVVVAFA